MRATYGRASRTEHIKHREHRTPQNKPKRLFRSQIIETVGVRRFFLVVLAFWRSGVLALEQQGAKKAHRHDDGVSQRANTDGNATQFATTNQLVVSSSP
jgi:hypothetical protein